MPRIKAYHPIAYGMPYVFMIGHDPITANIRAKKIDVGYDLQSSLLISGDSEKPIAKRLLVASMACAVVWEIASAKGKVAEEFRIFLIKLSGQQMKEMADFFFRE